MGVKLTFAPLGSSMINERPGDPVQQGLPIRRAGRTFKPGDAKKKIPASYPADKEPFSCDSNSALGRLCIKIMSRRDAKRQDGGKAPLACMDEKTACACGSPHVVRKPVWKDGVWSLSPKPEPKGKTSPVTGGKA